MAEIGNSSRNVTSKWKKSRKYGSSEEDSDSNNAKVSLKRGRFLGEPHDGHGNRSPVCVEEVINLLSDNDDDGTNRNRHTAITIKEAYDRYIAFEAVLDKQSGIKKLKQAGRILKQKTQGRWPSSFQLYTAPQAIFTIDKILTNCQGLKGYKSLLSPDLSERPFTALEMQRLIHPFLSQVAVGYLKDSKGSLPFALDDYYRMLKAGKVLPIHHEKTGLRMALPTWSVFQ